MPQIARKFELEPRASELSLHHFDRHTVTFPWSVHVPHWKRSSPAFPQRNRQRRGGCPFEVP
jgi:hypothetical protein